MISALDSGIECAIDTSSMSNSPTLKRLPSCTMVDRDIGRTRLVGTFGGEERAAVNGVA